MFSSLRFPFEHVIVDYQLIIDHPFVWLMIVFSDKLVYICL